MTTDSEDAPFATSAAFDPSQWPRRLNLGCGWDHREGYLNIDFLEVHGPDLVADVRNLSMLPSEHYEEIVAQDVLEHLTRADGPVALREWARLLRPGGTLVLRVPNLLGLAYIMTTMTSIDEQRGLVQCLFGTQAYDGDFHQNGYTELLLRHELREVGFGEATFEPMHEWLFDIVAIKTPATRELRLEDCTFMTTRRPSEAAEAAAQAHPATSAIRPIVSRAAARGRRAAANVRDRIRR